MLTANSNVPWALLFPHNQLWNLSNLHSKPNTQLSSALYCISLSSKVTHSTTLSCICFIKQQLLGCDLFQNALAHYVVCKGSCHCILANVFVDMTATIDVHRLPYLVFGTPIVDTILIQNFCIICLYLREVSGNFTLFSHNYSRLEGIFLKSAHAVHVCCEYWSALFTLFA